MFIDLGWGLAPSPRLECSGAVTAQCSIHLPASIHPPASASGIAGVQIRPSPNRVSLGCLGSFFVCVCVCVCVCVFVCLFVCLFVSRRGSGSAAGAAVQWRDLTSPHLTSLRPSGLRRSSQCARPEDSLQRKKQGEFCGGQTRFLEFGKGERLGQQKEHSDLYVGMQFIDTGMRPKRAGRDLSSRLQGNCRWLIP